MVDILNMFVKLALPIILALVTIFSIFKDVFFSRAKVFEEREKLSKLSYELYKITENEELKRLSVEYGYAAITKESFLNLAQRRALVCSENPTRDIDSFVKCRALLDIKTEPLSFVWRKKRYNNIIYYISSITFRTLFYIFGALLFFMPIIYTAIFPNALLGKLEQLSVLAKIGLILYSVFAGAFLAYVNLSSAVKLIDAAKLINRHREV